MNRLYRLRRSALASFAVCVGFLWFTAPGVAELLAGRPFLFLAMIALAAAAASAGALFLAVASRVERARRPQPAGVEAIEDALAA